MISYSAIGNTLVIVPMHECEMCWPTSLDPADVAIYQSYEDAELARITQSLIRGTK